MSGFRFEEKKENNIKILVMSLLLAVALFATYYIHIKFKQPVIFTHFFYIPIILSCIWWKRKGIFVALFLAGNLVFSHVFYAWSEGDKDDLYRAVMFIVVAFLIVALRERTSKVEDEAKLAYQKINQIFRTAGNGLRVIDKNFNMIQYNEIFLKILRVNKEEAEGKKCYEVFRGPLCHTPSCTLRRIFAGEELVECDIEKERNDGKKLFCILTATPLKGPDGKIIGIIEAVKDITDRKLAEEALKESEERYRSFVKNFKGIAMECDINFKPIFFHGAVESISGYTEEDFINERPRWDQIIHPDDLPKIYEISRKLQKTPNYALEREYRIICKDGRTKWVEEIIHNTCDESGKPVLIQSVLYDITERKETENALMKSEERFLQAQKMEAVGRLAGGIAHDFNNLLTIITGNCDLLLDEIDPHVSMRSDIEEIYKAGERATSLTRQLLAFSRRQMLQPKILDLNVVITETKKMLKRLIGEDIELVTILEQGIPIIKADPGQIEQVIMNLAINSRDAMPHGGRITIKTETCILDEDHCQIMHEGRPGRFVLLVIEDTGIGMDKQTLNQIFEPFFSTKGPGEGTGLGLATVYGIVKQHEGLITAYSEVGHGTCFKIYLPALSIKQTSDSKEGIPFDEMQGKGERILLVEDEEGVRRFAKKALDKNGYRVSEAACAQAAIDIFNKEKGNFHFVLSDVVLPDINGIQLVDQLLSQNPQVVVLLCSGYTDQKSQWPVICDRKFRFLKKPYSTSDLLKAIKDARDTKDFIAS